MNSIGDLKRTFLQEFSERLPAARTAWKTASENGNGDAFAEVVRYFHSLAGMAETFGYPLLGRLAGILDTLGSLIEKGKLERSPQLLELMKEGLDGVERFFRDVGSEADDTAKRSERLMTAGGGPAAAELGELDPKKLSKIMVVDDDPVSGKLIETCLQRAGYLTAVVNDPHATLEAISSELPDLIILDVVMPGIDGFELCRQIRRNQAMELVPIIFVSRKADIAEKVRGLRLGGDDYVQKPFEPEELIARVTSHLERLSIVREMAIRDGLTRTYNHKYFKLRLEQEIKRAQRYELPLSLAMIDLDHFKRVNDDFGHQVGDVVLVQLVQMVSAQLRASDVVARYGGEEFAVLLPQTPVDGAQLVMSRICARVAGAPFAVDVPGLPGRKVPVTISVGVTAQLKTDDPERMILRADRALYAAKDGGRNQVRIEHA